MMLEGLGRGEEKPSQDYRIDEIRDQTAETGAAAKKLETLAPIK